MSDPRSRLDPTHPRGPRGSDTALLAEARRLLEGAEPDPVLAVRYLRRASRLGNPEAMRILAHCYEVGAGVHRNPTQAAFWRRYASLAEASGTTM